jgi:protoporphyrinogen oxidase
VADTIVVGGGVQGMMIAYDLVQHGHRVTLLEAGPSLGGLAGAAHIDELDIDIDRFYHVILSSDRKLMALMEELGIADQLRFRTTRMAFLGKDGGLHSMSTPMEFLTFPLISLLARFRLGLSIVRAGKSKYTDALESESVEAWLRRTAGKENYERLWGPLLQSKFDDDFSFLPASYMWSRLKRMTSTRDKSGAEQMGHLVGGYQTLIEALRQRIESAGGVVKTGARVARVICEDEIVTGVELESGEALRADATVITVGNRLVDRWIGGVLGPAAKQPLESIGYMAIVCVVLMLDARVTDFYTINVVDRSYSLTGVIETTNVIDPELLGGTHLVYLPKYCAQDSHHLERDDNEVLEDFIGQLEKMVPTFDRSSIRASRVFRARETEPIHPLADARPMVPYAPLPGVFVVNSTQTYPDLVNCEAMCANVIRALTPIHATLGTAEVGKTALSRDAPQ